MAEPRELARQSYHESVRPARDDDVVVRLVVAPDGLHALREGIEVRHVRLDAVAGEELMFAMYVEKAGPRPPADDAIPADHTPHSPSYRPLRSDVF